MGDVLLERGFNDLLYHVVYRRLVNQNINDRQLRNPLPCFQTVFGGTPIKAVVPIFFIGNISFHVLDISKLKKSWCV